MIKCYYNEHDPAAAAWLRELIKDGLIMDGEVDERSIKDVQPADLRGFTRCHFFAGIGGWDLALQLAGWDPARPVWTGSCPCQPFSHAGKGEGAEDERHLWPAWFDLIRECRPDAIFGEQVEAAIRHGWLDLVSTDLEREDYAVAPVVLPAACVGSPQGRHRLWFVARPLREGHEGHGLQPLLRGGTGQREVAGTPGLRAVGVLADAGRGGAQPVGHDVGSAPGGDEGETRERERFRPDAGAVGAACELADDNDPGCGVGGEARLHDHGQRGDDTARRSADGFWDDCYWIPCRDEKHRPVIASHVGMADGLPAYLVRRSDLCLGKNEEVTCGEETSAGPGEVLRGVLKENASQKLCEQPRGQEHVCAQEVLRQDVHGAGDAGGEVRVEEPQQGESAPLGKKSVRKLRSVRKAARPSQRFGPFEQHTVELDDVVRCLPRQIALAQLHGRRKDEKALRALRQRIDAAGALLVPPVQGEEAWESIGCEEQERIRLGLGHQWVARSFLPLSVNEPARTMRLRAYGNAIVPQVAAEVIRAAMEVI